MPEAGNRATLALIGLLVSDFPPKHETGDWELATPGSTGVPGSIQYLIPATMTAEELNFQRVHQAYEALKLMGVVAFPDLVANSGDERYAFSAIYAAWNNHSVGQACFMIMEEQVDTWGYGYKGRESPGGRPVSKPQYLYAMRDSVGLKAWWASHKDWSLTEMQIESIEWTMSQEKATGFVDDAQRRLVLEPLEKRLAELER